MKDKTKKRSVEHNVTMNNETNLPRTYESVLALMQWTTESLLTETWYEVVHHDGTEWRSYFGRKTLNEHEKVINWVYCKDVCPKEGGDQ